MGVFFWARRRRRRGERPDREVVTLTRALRAFASWKTEKRSVFAFFLFGADSLRHVDKQRPGPPRERRERERRVYKRREDGFEASSLPRAGAFHDRVRLRSRPSGNASPSSRCRLRRERPTGERDGERDVRNSNGDAACWWPRRQLVRLKRSGLSSS